MFGNIIESALLQQQTPLHPSMKLLLTYMLLILVNDEGSYSPKKRVNLQRAIEIQKQIFKEKRQIVSKKKKVIYITW